MARRSIVLPLPTLPNAPRGEALRFEDLFDVPAPADGDDSYWTISTREESGKLVIQLRRNLLN
jgi:hypothetical protein